MKWGIHKRFKNGEIGAANKHILGYQYDDEQKKYVIIPEEAEAVRWMFQMYIDGVTLRDIADSMNKAGIRTTLGNDFQEASVRQLIFNEVYAGDIRRQKCYIEDPITKKKVPNRGELPQYYMADSHEAITDRDTYAKVKAEMERRASLVNPTYCFTGKFKCAVCGANFTRKKGRVRGKEYVDWICRSKKEPGVTCKSHNYPEHRLMEICAELMGTDGFDEGAFERNVKQTTSLADDSIEMQLYGGEVRRWQMPSKPKKTKPESKRSKHLFDGKIFCGKCGRRFGSAMSDTTDGGHLYWYCRAKSNHGITCDSVNYPDAEIGDIFCRVMGKKTFDEDYFTKTVDHMVVQASGSIDFHLKDGTVRRYETLKLRSNRHETTSTDEFTGMIRCDCCGNLYHGYCGYGKYVYWRCSGKHKVRTERNGQMREELRGRKTYGEILLEGKYELYSVLDSLQNAFVLFEMLPLELTGNVRQFRLKYCNTAMEEMTGLTFQEMLERRIQKIMPRTSLEWKTVLEEVAISSRTHYLRGTTRKNGKGGRFIILCFQPLGGYCGCVFLPVRES